MRTVIVRPPISAPFMICVAACASSGVEYLTVPKPLHMHTRLLIIFFATPDLGRSQAAKPAGEAFGEAHPGFHRIPDGPVKSPVLF